MAILPRSGSRAGLRMEERQSGRLEALARRETAVQTENGEPPVEIQVYCLQANVITEAELQRLTGHLHVGRE